MNAQKLSAKFAMGDITQIYIEICPRKRVCAWRSRKIRLSNRGRDRDEGERVDHWSSHWLGRQHQKLLLRLGEVSSVEPAHICAIAKLATF
ncbi:hypothetical protein EVAR_68432_1 [Eumeta japonica]|uniref:Uncharacterized protein n=1 Tax=Eumeta variegata TaxID=151549 RepID=A0A4C2A0U1_EUMVA|nr:hypothetical protein EVAR_68432_1 [Eumeta japonica]